MNLPEPTSNERQAFCTRGCYNSFYLHRCRVCEDALPKAKGRPRVVCKKAKCRNAWNAGEGFGKYAVGHFVGQVSKNPGKAQETAAAQAVLSASGAPDWIKTAYAERPWRMVAGRLTANQYHCAIVSDAPDGGLPDIPYARVWADGAWQAAEGRNRKLLEKHFAGLKDEPTPGPEIPRLDTMSVTSRPDLAIPDDLPIPPFLDRRPLPLQKAA
jgi:hypothetical protein